MHAQLTDALKRKFTKCDHIDVDWAVVNSDEEEIYQTSITYGQQNSAVPAPSSGGTEGILRKSETVGSFQDEQDKGEQETGNVVLERSRGVLSYSYM